MDYEPLRIVGLVVYELLLVLLWEARSISW